MIKKCVIISLLLSFCFRCISQNINCYENAFDSLLSILKESSNRNKFSEGVFVVEELIAKKGNYKDSTILNAISTIALWVTVNKKKNETLDLKINQAISLFFKGEFEILKDSTFYQSTPFRFNFTDPLGKKDITNTFVSKLLATHQGNCRSLTYLYKILADELGAKCWIALAPGHMYIKNYSEKIGWYNTELTSGTFPTDAWIMASSYINPTAVMSGMYMDTLSNQQAIALCVLDLAHLYERQTKNYYDGFILKCCDLVLKYHPVNPMALLLKAETLKKLLIREKSSKYPRITYTAKEMEQTYLKLFDLGYREMPYKMKKQKQKEDKENAKKYNKPAASK